MIVDDCRRIGEKSPGHVPGVLRVQHSRRIRPVEEPRVTCWRHDMGKRKILRRAYGADGARIGDELGTTRRTDERHRGQLGLAQQHRATRRQSSYRDRLCVGSWHLPRPRPLSNFRPWACVARRWGRRARNGADGDGDNRRTRDRLVRDATPKHSACAPPSLSPFRARSTADRGYLRIRAPRGRSRADGTQCRLYRTTDVHHFGKHTGHVIPRWTWAPRGLLLPLPQKTASRSRPRSRRAGLSPGRSGVWARRDTTHHHIGSPWAALRATRKRNRTMTRWVSVGARESGRDHHDTAAVTYRDENYCAGQPLRERAQVCLPQARLPGVRNATQ